MERLGWPEFVIVVALLALMVSPLFLSPTFCKALQ